MDDDKLKISSTTDGQPPRPGFEHAAAPAPARSDGQHEAYWILSAEERAKGFVRPVRKTYRHIGAPGPTHPLRTLDADELKRYSKFGYLYYEEYPYDPERPQTVGRYWRQCDLDRVNAGCGCDTTMGLVIAETYARDPRYYGSTFCCYCQKHFPVGEFVWVERGDRTEERVGT